MPQQITQNLRWLAAPLLLVIAPGSSTFAQQGEKDTPAIEKMIANPFVTPQYRLAPSNSPPAQPKSPTGSSPRPGTTADVAAARLPTVQSLRPLPANPFADNAIVPARQRPLRWGPVSRWRQPDIAGTMPYDAGTLANIGEIVPDPVETTIADEKQRVPVPQSSASPLQPATQPIDLQPVAAANHAGFADNPDEIAERQSLEPQPATAQPVMLANGMETVISQPTWLLPDAVSESSLTSWPAARASAAAHSEKADSSAAAAGRQPSDRRPPVAVGPFDPFEEPDSDAVVITDASADEEISDEVKLLSTDEFRAHLAEIEQLAQSSDSIESLTEIINRCRELAAQPMAVTFAHDLRSMSAWAYNRRGELFDEDGRPEAALEDFQTAIEVDPQSWSALHNRAICYARAQEHDLALRDFNAALEANPQLSVAYRNRGELMSALGRTDAAVDDYTSAIGQQPGNAELYVLRGHAQHRLRSYADAMSDYHQAIQLDAEIPPAYTGRGNLFAEIGQFDRALDDFQKAIELDSQFSDAYRSQAWLLATCPDRRYRHPQRALAAAQKAAEFGQPGDPFLLEALAAAYAINRRYGDAAALQRRAIVAVPTELAAPLERRLQLYERERPFLSGLPTDVQPASYERPAGP